MNEFEIVITETLEKKIKVKADTYEQAVSIIEEEYKKEKIVLDSSDFVTVNIGWKVNFIKKWLEVLTWWKH